MQKIIFINRFFYPDQSATSQILSDLLFNIHTGVDAELHVVTSRSLYQGGGCLPASEIVNGVNVHRVWTSNFGRKTLPGRVLDYLTFYISTFFRLLILSRKGDVLVAKTDPPVISIVAYVVSRLKGARLINWIQDLFPEVAGALGVIKPGSLLYRMFKRIKNVSVNAAVCNVVIGERMKDRLIAEGVNKDKVQVIHNWNINQDEKYIGKHDNHLVNDWGLNDKFVIGYSGNFGRAHEYEPVKFLIKKFVNDPKLVFLFIGGGKYYDDLKHYVNAHNIHNVLFRPYQNKDQLSYSLSVADVHIISLIPELEGLIVPSKFYGLAAIGVPVIFIGDENGEVGKILKDSNSGFVVSPDHVDDLVVLVDKLATGAERTDTVKANLKHIYDTGYKPDVCYKKWTDILRTCDQ